MADVTKNYPALADMEAVALFQDLGYRFTNAGDGWAEITLDATPKTHNLYGIVHGGVWLILADSTMGGALGTVVDDGEQVITVQAEFRWLRALNGNAIRARAHVLRRGRSVNHCAVDLFDSDDELIGRGSGTYVVLPPP